MGSLGTAEEAWRQALSFARRGGYRAELAESISWLMVSAVFGPLPVEEGIAALPRVPCASDGGEPTIRAACSVEGAVLEAMRGDLEKRGTSSPRAEHDRGGRPDALGGAQRAGDLPDRAAGWHPGCGDRDAPQEL